MLADGHVLIEDFPGLGKTLMARSFAAARSACDFAPHPVHARPAAVRRDRLVDLRPARRRASSSGPGPVFANLLLADEINRAPPKTQAALLEAMAGAPGHGRGRDAPRSSRRSSCSRPRTRSSTRAPTRCPRRSSTASCVRLGVGYPTRDDEWQVLERRARAADRRGRARAGRRRATSCSAMQAARRGGPRRRSRSASTWSTSSRRRASARQVQVGAQPARLARAAEARRAAGPRSTAATSSSPDDVKAIAVPALAHRLTLRPGAVGAARLRRRRRARLPDPRPGAGAAGRRRDRRSREAVPDDPASGVPGARCAACCSRRSGSRRPELVAVAAPFGLIAAVGLARVGAARRDRAYERPDELRAIEGDRGHGARRDRLAAAAMAGRGAAWPCRTALTARWRPDPAAPCAWAAGTASVPFELACERWGGFVVPRPGSGCASRSACACGTARSPTPLQVRVHPQIEPLRQAPRPVRTQASVGSDTQPHGRARASSSPTCGRTSTATGCGASTGA